ncbi:MAG: radical SAM family RiPP maturation amino acid epimerase [Firmicutes bacterium]|nr:radical SAM family RiPP maturation amino acid epimerase [Bacillota bacterium]
MLNKIHKDIFNDIDLHKIAHTKFIIDLKRLNPKLFKEPMNEIYNNLQIYGVDLTNAEINTILNYIDKDIDNDNRNLPTIIKQFKNFKELLSQRFNEAHSELCAPKDPRLKKWRERQIRRVKAHLGNEGKGLIHFTVSFELTSGCSVGCPFCAISSKKLDNVFDYSERNVALWKGVLNKCLEIIGGSAKYGVCYYGTEPFDNPNYEKFCSIYADILGHFPQTTSAVPMRDVNRTRTMLTLSREKNNFFFMNRFSILSNTIRDRVFNEFTPEELLFVGLLNRFDLQEEPKLIKAGRARSTQNQELISQNEGGTVSCLSGFLVNMAERTIRHITPCNANEKWPTGQWEIDRESFTDADDFGDAIQRLIDKNISDEAPRTKPLKFYPWLSYEELTEKTNGFGLRSKASGLMTFKNMTALSEIGEKITEGCHTPRQIAAILNEQYGYNPAYVYNTIDFLFNHGVIDEEPQN